MRNKKTVQFDYDKSNRRSRTRDKSISRINNNNKDNEKLKLRDEIILRGSSIFHLFFFFQEFVCNIITFVIF